MGKNNSQYSVCIDNAVTEGTIFIPNMNIFLCFINNHNNIGLLH